MRRIIILFSVILTSLSIFASGKNAQVDSITYKCDTGIFYYNTKDVKGLERCRLDIYYPTNKKAFKTVVWFHGGGLNAGNKEIPADLQNQGFAIIGVGYRLSPAAKCPSYIEDAAAAVAWAFQNIQKYGGDTNQIYVAGHSAGAYLTLMIGLDKKWLSKYNIDANKIAALFPFSAQTVTHTTILKERGENTKIPLIDEYAPLHHIRADAPPVIITAGDSELELTGRCEGNMFLARMMKEIGHKSTYFYKFDGLDHVEMLRPSFQILLKYLKKEEGVSKVNFGR